VSPHKLLQHDLNIDIQFSTTTYTPEVTVTDYTNKKRRRAPVPAPEPTLEIRQVTVAPSSIPAYASPCSGSVRYSSACSCIGVTATTTTAPTPTYVVTAATATSTVFDTYPEVDFTGYDDSGCGGDNLGSGAFIENQCVELPDQISLADDALNPGTCADTSSCVLNLYIGSGCSSDYFAKSVPVTAGCIYVGDVLYGLLVCPAC
jgi:hypothetical protein